MSFASKLWPSRAKEALGTAAGEAKTSPPTALTRLLRHTGVAAKPKGKPPHPEAPIFDSFVAKAERERLRDAEIVDATLDADAGPSRQTDRFVPLQTNTTVLDDRGKRHRARIINLSATGVAIEADFAAIPADTITHVGSLRVSEGRTMRHGVVFVFEKPLDPDRCHAKTIL